MLNKSNKLIWSNLRCPVKTTSLCDEFPCNLIFFCAFYQYWRGFQPNTVKLRISDISHSCAIVLGFEWSDI